MKIASKTIGNLQSRSNPGLQKMLKNRQALQKKVSKLKTEQGNPQEKQKELKKLEKQIASLNKEIQKSRSEEKKSIEQKKTEKITNQMNTPQVAVTAESDLLNKTSKVIMSSSDAITNVKKLGRLKKKLLKQKKILSTKEKVLTKPKIDVATKKIKATIDEQLKVVKNEIEDKSKHMNKEEKVYQYKKQMVLQDK